VGEFELEADLQYRTEGPIGTSTRRVKHKAVLTVVSDDDMQLMSSAGLCQADRKDSRVRNRRFLCGEATYDIEPSGRALVSGHVSVRAEVMERGPRTCVQYRTNDDGSRTCIRWDQPLQTNWKSLRESLDVRRLSWQPVVELRRPGREGLARPGVGGGPKA
jgi:hypothetical protein